MASFSFVMGSAASNDSLVAWVEAKDDTEALNLAREWLRKSDHLQEIEVQRGELTVVVRRAEPTFSKVRRYLERARPV